MSSQMENEIDVNMISEMVYEKKRLKTFLQEGQWPFLKDCNCTPEKMASAGFYWCGSENQPDLARCFVCLKEFEDWDPDDIPSNEHKRLCPDCPFIKLGKKQDDCTVKEVMELCHKSLSNLVQKGTQLRLERYTLLAKEIRQQLELLADFNKFDD